MHFEQRKYPRYSVEENQIVVMCGSDKGIATVRDISAGGIKLQYVPLEGNETEWNRVNIFSALCNHFFVEHVDCRTVYDIASLMEAGTFSGMNVRTSGLCFSRLTGDQETALRRILKWCAWRRPDDG